MSATPTIAPAPAGPTHTVHGYAALERDAPITPFDFEQREPRPDDVTFDVLFCGICHTDLHYKEGAINDDYPFLLGHEVAGVVESVGEGVTNVASGDFVVLAWRAPCSSSPIACG